MQDCFGKKGCRCTVTINKSCPDKCSFYKTKKQFNEDFIKAKKILDKKGLTDRIRKSNPIFDGMCRKICR